MFPLLDTPQQCQEDTVLLLLLYQINYTKVCGKMTRCENIYVTFIKLFTAKIIQ